MRMRLNLRYCAPCDEWMAPRHYVCPKCGADTDPAEKLTANERAQGMVDEGHEDWLEGREDR